jgi:iron complex transport system substrate-binding protein
MIRFLICFSVFWVMQTAPLDAADITYTDKMGRLVTIPVPVKRAVIFQTSELIPVLGIWDNVVGIGKYAYESDLLSAAKPDIEQTIPSASAGSGGDINIEVLLKVNPDLIVTWSYYPEQVKFMQAKGLRVIALYIDSISEMYSVMRLHGKMFERERKVSSSISRMERIFNLIRRRTAMIPSRERKKVLWLYGRPTQVSGSPDLPVAIIRLIGGTNAADTTIGERTADVSMEQIIAWDPDVIFIWGHAKYEAQEILDNSQWRNVKAVKNGKVFKAPKWSTWSPRIAPMALWMAKKTYPDRYDDIDLDQTTDEFMKNVFGVPYAKMMRFDDSLVEAQP